jgi:hypothetical protein
MHIKIGDPFKKMMPASILLFLNLVICVGSAYSK